MRKTMEINGQLVDVTTVMDKSVTYTPTFEQGSHIVDECENLLNEYFDCLKDNEGLWKMFGQSGLFWERKGWLIDRFIKHPFYNGNLQIVLRDQEMSRHLDMNGVWKFKDYFDKFMTENRTYVNPKTGETMTQSMISKTRESHREKMRHFRFKYDQSAIPAWWNFYEKERRLLNNFQDRIYEMEIQKEFKFVEEIMGRVIYEIDNTNNHLISDELMDIINYYKDRYNVKFTGTRAGQKISKLVGKLAKMVGLDKHVDIQDISFHNQDGELITRQKDMGWNYQFAAFADSINPIPMKGTAVISINPYDFYTMSFGYKWASCHTIDKENKRGVSGSHYSGCYCGGTESYMLDSSTIIFYSLPQDWNGEHPEYEDKVKRCVFYLGEDKLIQSRVYPDGRDGGDASLAGDIRTIMQKVVAELFDVPNYWTNEKGTEICGKVTTSTGPHYRDYLCYEDCNVSFLKRIDGYKNMEPVHIGSRIICPSCGTIHDSSENIFCQDCLEEEVECYDCGYYVSREDAYQLNGHWYCPDCVRYCDNCDDLTTRDEQEEDIHGNYICRWCQQNRYTWSEYEDLWVPDDEVITTEEGNVYYCESDGYGYCEECDEYHDEDEIFYDEVTDRDYCRDCYERLLAEREEESEDSEVVA